LFIDAAVGDVRRTHPKAVAVVEPIGNVQGQAELKHAAEIRTVTSVIAAHRDLRCEGVEVLRRREAKPQRKMPNDALVLYSIS
jgi:hypothetical protein